MILLKKFAAYMLAIIFTFSLLGINLTKATGELDQSNETGSGDYRNITTWHTMQTFTPTKQYVDSVSIFSNGVATTLTISIAEAANPYTDHASKTVDVPSGEVGWRTVTFDSAVNVEKIQHAIKVTSTSGSASWQASYNNAYAGGCALINYTCQTMNGGVDLLFRTFGHDDAAPSSTPATPENTAASDNASASPAAPSSSIAKPTSLKAEAGAKVGEVKLTWTASTSSSIEGYKVFRSEQETKGFLSIGTTKKAIKEYSDATGKAGQKYYYFVRAYQGSTESESSNTVNFTVTSPSAPQTPANFKITSRSPEKITFTWNANTETDLSGYILEITKDDKVIESVNIGKAAITYDLLLKDHNLLNNKDIYAATLQAKNDKELASIKTKTQTFSFAASPAGIPQKTPLWVYAVDAAGALLAIAGIITLILIVRKRKSKVSKTPAAN